MVVVVEEEGIDGLMIWALRIPFLLFWVPFCLRDSWNHSIPHSAEMV